MYYTYACTYCSKIFYAYGDNRQQGAQALVNAIKAHQVDFGEDHKDYQMDQSPEELVNLIYNEVEEYDEEPAGDYKVAA